MSRSSLPDPARLHAHQEHGVVGSAGGTGEEPVGGPVDVGGHTVDEVQPVAVSPALFHPGKAHTISGRVSGRHR